MKTTTNSIAIFPWLLCLIIVISGCRSVCHLPDETASHDVEFVVDSSLNAILCNNKQELKISLEHGLDPNGAYRYDYCGNHTYRNPLDLAIECQDTNLISMLISHGGRPNAKSYYWEFSAWRAIDAAYDDYLRNGNVFPLSVFLERHFAKDVDNSIFDFPSRYLLETVLETSFPMLKTGRIHLFLSHEYKGSFDANNRNLESLVFDASIDSDFWHKWLSTDLDSFWYEDRWVPASHPVFHLTSSNSHGTNDHFDVPSFVLTREQVCVPEFDGTIVDILYNPKISHEQVTVGVYRIFLSPQFISLQNDVDTFVQTNGWWIRLAK